MTSTTERAGRVTRPVRIPADANSGPPLTPAAALTAREREVVTMIGRGLSTRRIAAALAVSGRTVEWHVANIQRKLGLESRVQIAVWALHDGERASAER